MTDPVVAIEANPKGSIIMAMIWMLLLSLLLFWIPPFGSLIAGVVGGKTAGGALRGLLAALLASIVVVLFIAMLGGTLGTVGGWLLGIPGFGALLGGVYGFGLGVGSLIMTAPLLLGALIGGLLS